MANEDPLKVEITYAVDGNLSAYKFITTEDKWDALVEEIENPAGVWIHIDAKINDIDANRLRAGILRESIRSYDCITVNGL